MSLFLFAFQVIATDMNAILEEQVRRAEFVIVGYVVESVIDPDTRKSPFSVAQMVVDRHLLGTPSETNLLVQSDGALNPESRPVIWFINPSATNGRYVIDKGAWGTNSIWLVENAINRVDKTTRIKGLPPVKTTSAPISLTIGADNGKGEAILTCTADSFRDIRIILQFENHSDDQHAVMPCLDGSASHLRYPHYDLFVLDHAGNPVQRKQGGRYGNIDPLRKYDIVPLDKGEVFRASFKESWIDATPGMYTVALRYTAKQEIASRSERIGRNDEDVETLIKTVWEGSLTSNWINVKIKESAEQIPVGGASKALSEE